MKTSRYENDSQQEEQPETMQEEETQVIFETVNMSVMKKLVESEEETRETVTKEVETTEESFAEELVRRIEIYNMERWSDSASQVSSLPGPEDAEAPGEPASEMYYTASSEVSLLSDCEPPAAAAAADTVATAADRKECVVAGHVAAMRERFENMTRTNTPCPDLGRSLSPSLEFRNVTPSPDRLG